MTVGATESAEAAPGRLAGLDPGYAALRRAARVTVAACLAFYPLRYGVGDPVSSTYGLFAAVALGALSDVQGTPPARTRTYLAAIAAGAVLITVGTLAAVSTAVAAAGMLVVGFAVAYAGVAGPRVAGVATGLQLFYVLPCFPPFAPDTLGQRLAGLAVGGLLLVAADRLVWPAPAPPHPGDRLADACGRLGAYAAALAPVVAGSPAGAGLADARRAALDAAARVRLADIPVAQRPLGPGVRDRGLLAAGAATRVAAMRLAGLADLVAEPAERSRPRIAHLVGAVADVFGAVATALRSGRPAPVDTSAVDDALERYLAERAAHLADPGRAAGDLRIGLAAAAIAEEARLAAVAAGGFLGAPPPDRSATPRLLMFLHDRWPTLLWRRLRVHLTPRSVYLQNAVRLAVGLAAARVVAGTLNLSHGFWVLLATLSLMRTSAVAGRAVLLRAFAGTVAGALVAAVLLAVLGTHTGVYAAILPVVMVLALAAGPVFGVAAGQAAFTIVVALVFVQLAPAGWELAGVRLADVVVGGVVGALIGAAVWPRGASGEIRRAGAAGLRAGAAVVRDTTAELAGSAAGPVDGPESARLHRLAALFDHTYVQFRTEPAGVPGPDWLLVLAVVHRIDDYAALLRTRHAGPAVLPPQAAAALEAAAADVAAAYEAAADAIGAGRAPRAGVGASLGHRLADVPVPAGEGEPALRLVDLWGWLQALADDLGRLERACDPHAAR